MTARAKTGADGQQRPAAAAARAGSAVASSNGASGRNSKTDSSTDSSVPRGARSPHAAPREFSVFVNCPYDAAYQSIFDAILLTLLCHGMWPRWAADRDPGGTRLDRIVAALRGSRYSIHDLSRCKGEGDENLARMNMPLELGMALEQAYPHGDPGRDHRCIVLMLESGMPDKSSYSAAISDIKAFDPLLYDGRPDTMVSRLASFLKVGAERTSPVSVYAIQRALPRWDKLLARQRVANGGDPVTWSESVALWHALADRLWRPAPPAAGVRGRALRP